MVEFWALVQLAEPVVGFAAFAVAEYGPWARGTQTATAMLSDILLFQFLGASAAALGTSERINRKYSQVSSAQVSGAVLVGLIMAHLGDDRGRERLQLNASNIDTWEDDPMRAHFKNENVQGFDFHDTSSRGSTQRT